MSRVFKLGYVDKLDEPFVCPCLFYSTPQYRCNKPGISGEIWLEIAATLNYTLQFVQADSYGEYEPDVNGRYTGVLGMVQDGTVDGTLTFASLRPTRFAYFNYSEMAQSYESGLVIGEIVESKRHIQVQVFDWLVVLLLFLFLGLVGVFNYLILNRQPHHSTFHLNWININPTLLRFSRLQCSLPNSVLALAFTIINLTYFAGFRSQVMTASQHSTDRTFEEFFASPRSKVIVGTNTTLNKEHKLAIFGKSAANAQSRIIVEPNIEVIAETLCANPNVAYYTDRVDIFMNSQNEPNCNLKTLSGNATAISFKGTRAYIVSKRTPAKEMERMNEIILKLFNIDHNEAYLYPKYGIFPRTVTYKGQILYNMSISLSQLIEGFLFVAAAFVTATLLLIAEVLHHKWTKKGKKKKVIAIPAQDGRWITPIFIPAISYTKWLNRDMNMIARYSRA